MQNLPISLLKDTGISFRLSAGFSFIMRTYISGTYTVLACYLFLALCKCEYHLKLSSLNRCFTMQAVLVLCVYFTNHCLILWCNLYQVIVSLSCALIPCNVSSVATANGLIPLLKINSDCKKILCYAECHDRKLFNRLSKA